MQAKTAPAATAGTKRHQTTQPLSEPETKKQPPARQVMSCTVLSCWLLFLFNLLSKALGLWLLGGTVKSLVA